MQNPRLQIFGGQHSLSLRHGWPELRQEAQTNKSQIPVQHSPSTVQKNPLLRHDAQIVPTGVR